MAKSKTLINCSLSAVVSYGALVSGGVLHEAGVPEAAFLLIPGLAFSLALDRSSGRAVSPAWRIVMAVVIVAGWYAAYYSAQAIETPYYVAGAVAGAIGGASLFVVLLPHARRRTSSNATLLVAAGAAIGAIALPAGFLFGAADNLNYLFLTFLPWQIIMGLIVADG